MSDLPPIGSMPPTDAAADARSWIDGHGLDSLKSASAKDPSNPATIRAVAQQFESLFVSMMLKSMRDAKLGDGLFESDQSRLYQDMFDQQLSQTMSQGRGIGIADMLVRSLTAHGTPQLPPEGAYGLPKKRVASPVATAAALAPLLGTDAVSAPSAAGDTAAAHPGVFAGTPEEFVALVMPVATAAGSVLGVDPKALVAQAALESNWGRQVPAAEGGSSYNLFGIKANPDWAGRRVVKDTLEFAGGVAERRREPFRAYDSVAHGFADYVELLRSHDRYSAALEHGADPERFAEALQRAGYATDPAYSTKIAAVLHSSTFRNAVAALKDVPEPPIF